MRADRRTLTVTVGSCNETGALLSGPRVSDTLLRRVDGVLDNGRTRRNRTVAETLAVGLVKSTSSTAEVKESTGEQENSSTTNSDTGNGSSRKRLLSASVITVRVGAIIVFARGCGRSRIVLLLWPFVSRS